MANMFDQFDEPESSGNMFDQFDEPAQPKPASNDPWAAYARHMSQQQSAPEPENDDWPITRGFKAGIDQTQAMVGALAAVSGDALGADKLREWGLESYQKNMQEAEAHSGDTVTSWADIEGLGDLADYVMYGTGNAVAQFLPSLATGGAGSLIGRQLVKKSAMEILERELKKGATREQAAEAARKKLIQGSVAGGTSAAGVTGIGLSAGEIGAELYEETGDLNPGVAVGFGTVAGILDMLPVTRVLDKVGLGKEFRDRVTQSVIKDVGIQALYEGGTEGLQTVIEKAAVKFVDENKDIFTAENLVEIGDAIAFGAFGGTAIRTATRAADGVFGPRVGDGTGSDGDAAAELDRMRQRDLDREAEAAAEEVKAQGGDALSAELARNEVFLRGEPMVGATFTPDQFQPIPTTPAPEGTIDYNPFSPEMQQPISVESRFPQFPQGSQGQAGGIDYQPPTVPSRDFSLVDLAQQGGPVGNEIEFSRPDVTNEKAAGIEALIAENEYRDIGLDAAQAEPVVEPEGYQPGPGARESIDRAELSELEALYEKTRQQLPQREKGNQTAGNQDMDILQFIASEGGISTEEAKARGFDSGDTGKRAGGIARVFTKQGKSFDAMAERLAEEGFFDGRDYTPNELEDMVRRGLSGEMVFSPRSEKAAMAQAVQMDLERIRQAMDDLQGSRDEDVADPPKGRAWQNESDPVRQLGYAVVEAEALGVPQSWIDEALDGAQTPEQAIEAVRRAIEDEKQFRGFWFGSEGQGESGGQGDQAAPRGPEAAEEGRGAEAAAEAVVPPLELTQETEQQRAEREQAQREANEKAAQEAAQAAQKAEADADRDSFTLTGSDRPADVLAAQGQGGLFEGGTDAEIPDGGTRGPADAQADEAGGSPTGEAVLGDPVPVGEDGRTGNDTGGAAPTDGAVVSGADAAADGQPALGGRRIGAIAGKGHISGKFLGTVDGKTIPGGALNSEAEALEAARRYAERLDQYAEESAQQESAQRDAATKILSGENPTKEEWLSTGLVEEWQVDRGYVYQPDISGFLVEHLGVPKNNIRNNIGAAGGVLRSDMGGERPIVYLGRLAGVFGSDGQPALILAKDGSPFKTEAAAKIARGRKDLQGRVLTPVQVDGGWALQEGSIQASAPEPSGAAPAQGGAEGGDLGGQIASMSDADLSSLFDEVASEGEPVQTEKPEAQRPKSTTTAKGTKRPRRSRTKAENTDTTNQEAVDRTAGEIAKSLGVNLSDGGKNALSGLTKLFGGPGKLNSGLSFDEKTYAEAKPHFQAMLADFSAAGRDLRDLIKALIDTFGTGVKPYLMRFAQDLRAESGNAEYSTGDQAGDRSNRQDAVGATSQNLQDEGRGEGGRGAVEPGEGAGGRSEAGAAVAGERDTADGERGGQLFYDEKSRLEAGAARDTDDTGSRPDSTGGLFAERESDGGANSLTEETPPVIQKAKPAKGSVKPADIPQVKSQMPFLTDGQAEDVVFAERRFAKPDGFGVLFTNGTGTGKTFTGLGILRRMIDSGKGRILIAVPKQPIADAWIDAGRDFFGVKISKLEGTNDAGRGVVITTYANMGDNTALAKEDWDAFFIDEAHYLASNQQGDATKALNMLNALGRKTDSATDLARLRNPELFDRIAELQEKSESLRRKDNNHTLPEEAKIKDELERLYQQRNDVIEAAREDVAGTADADKPRAVFLSATPFAYEKNVRWAQEWLFDWNPKNPSGRMGENGYNSGSNYDRFMMTHFGYRMRYNKLTEPDSKVDRGLMQRAFNSWLRKEGVLSARALDSDFDYDRRFVMAESAIGRRVDAALEWLRNHSHGEDMIPGVSGIAKKIEKKFDYQSRMYFLEAIKAKESVEHIRSHLDMGRKVVVIHDFKQGGTSNPFKVVFSSNDDEAAFEQRAYEEFRKEFDDVVTAFDVLQSPIDQLSSEFPGALIYNGDVTAKNRIKLQDRFNSDDPGSPQLMIAQSDAMREGVSIHDTSGKHPRVEVNLGMPGKPTAAIQLEGRIYRTGQASDAMFRYFTIGTNWERYAFASKIAGRTSAAENLAMGDEARGLKEAFINAYEEADAWQPGHEGEGIGGKETDKAYTSALTPWDMAKSFYFGTKKQGKGRGARGREGKDYFATPEPVGLKMVQMADLRGGESALEPSAGHGAIARWFPENTTNRAIEFEDGLASKTALHFDGDVLTGDFMDHNIVNKYDAIVMNPPFGQGGAQARDHVEKAIKHLRNGGRIVALVPTGPAADAKFEKLLDSDAAKDIYLAGEIRLPAVTFERAGTGVMTRILVLEKQTDPDLAAQIQQQSRDYSSVGDISELFDRMESLELRQRIQPEETAEAGAQAPETGGMETWEAKHTKTGATLYMAKMTDHLERDDYKKVSSLAKENGGYWSKFGKAGFLFKSEEDRSAFLSALDGGSDAAFSRTSAPLPNAHTPDTLRAAMQSAFKGVGKALEDGGLLRVITSDEIPASLQSAAFSVTGYHGSPYRFDRFSLDAIGTGEGNQAYGWGLYFAGRREVAEFYRDTLSRDRMADIDPDDMASAFYAELAKSSSVDGAVLVGPNREAMTEDEFVEAWLEEEFGPFDFPAPVRDAVERNFSGQMYQVKLPAEDTYLLWDRPLTEQSEKVRNLLRGSTGQTYEAWRESLKGKSADELMEIANNLDGNNTLEDEWGSDTTDAEKVDDIGEFFDYYHEDDPEAFASYLGAESFMDTQSGEGIYNQLTIQLGSQQSASGHLRSLGISGIKYLDGDSRQKPLKDVKREFLAELPEDARIEDVQDLLGTGTFSPVNEALIEALIADDWLGFDYPAQAISAALGGQVRRWDPSPELLSAISQAQSGGTFNYVVFDDSLIEIEEVFYSKAGRIQGYVKDGVVHMVADNISRDTDVKGLMMHEIGVHLAKLGKSDAEFQSILKHMETLRKSSPKVKAAFARVPSDTPAHLVSEEALGYLVERNPNMPLAKRILSWFRAKLREWGGKLKGLDRARFMKWANALNEDDLIWLASSATRQADSIMEARQAEESAQGESPAMASRQRQIDTPEFRRWFGDSKVVDENGEPLVVYHGTDAGDLTEFDARDRSLEITKNSLGENIGTFFAANKNHARDFGGHIIPVYLSLQNPAVFKSQVDFREFMREHSGRTEDTRDDEGFIIEEGQFQNRMRETLEAQGYDGVVIKRPGYTKSKSSDRSWFIAFRPEQIKSAIGNRGTFDPENHDIRYSRARHPFTLSGSNPSDSSQTGVRAQSLLAQHWGADPAASVQAAIQAAKRENLPDVVDWLKVNRDRVSAAEEGRGDVVFSVSQDEDLADIADRVLAKPEENTIRNRIRRAISQHSENFGVWAKQGMVDQFASIADLEKKARGKLLDAKESAYKAAAFSKNTNTVLEVAMHFGAVEYRDGAVQIKDKSLGLMEVLEPLTNTNLLREWELWAGAVRAKRLLAEGKERNYSPEDVALVLSKVSGAKLELFQRVHKDWIAYNKATLDFAEAAGLINAEQRKVWEKDDYVPFHRVSEFDGSQPEGHGPGGLSGQKSGIRKLEGGVEKISIVESMVRNTAHMIDASMKNVAMQRTLGLAEEMGVVDEIRTARIPDDEAKQRLDAMGIEYDDDSFPIWKAHLEKHDAKEGTVSVSIDGKTKRYIVRDPLLLSAMTSLGPTGVEGIMRVLRFPKKLLTDMVTAEPSFAIRNFIRDTLSTWATVHTGRREPISGALKGVLKSYREDPNFLAMMAQGVGGSGFYDTSPEGARAHLNKLAGKGKVITTIGEAWNAYRRILGTTEQANRIAVYESALKSGASKAEAAYQAMDVLNFSRHGDFKAMRILIQLVPFMNARVQGLDKLWRGAKEGTTDWKQFNRQFMLKGAMITAATLALLARNWDEEEYWDLEEWERDTYYHFWVNGEHYRLPKPFEVGAIFSTIPERMFEQFRDDANSKLLGRRMLHMIADTFAMDPTPQFVKPAMEVAMNRSTFTGRDILSMGMKFAAPEAQYSPYTSKTFIEIADAMPDSAPEWMRSPARLEHLFRGYFGTLGGYTLMASDYVAREATNAPDRPSLRTRDIPVVNTYIRDGVGTNKQVGRVYEMADTVNKAYSAIRKYHDEGRRDKAESVKQENLQKLRTRTALNKATRRMSEISSRIKKIYDNPVMSPEAKRREIDKLMQHRNELAKEISERYYDLF